MQKDDSKKIKDPVYGYVSIPVQYIKGIIDTSCFQRLRRVIQTSYSPLYASAIHNRFVYSIGVFHLGKMAAEQLKNVIVRKGYLSQELAENYAEVYQLACLLHDVGHAPFSHTGEIFYKNEKFESKELHKRLCSLISTESFKKDIPIESDSAAPHELMSAIVGLNNFGDFFKSKEYKELFARCITGYLYSAHNVENDIKNCFISMLNSKVIDVDRLDYLIRDSYASGFATINIDYVRLLDALTIIEERGRYSIAYQKAAVSIIENVVYAHDAEKKWIQSHPTVLYDAYILKHILEYLNEQLNSKTKRLFSEESLGITGQTLKDRIKVSLLCDDDIIYLSKNLYQDELSREFFERKKRRHPVWKSEEEYKAYIGNLSTGGELKETFLDCMKSFNESKAPDHPIPMVINEALIARFEKELQEAKNSKFAEENVIAIQRQLAVCKYLQNYVMDRKMPFDFVIIPTNMFNSNFSKKYLGEVKIVFGKDGQSKVCSLSSVCNLLKADAGDKDLYYLFYRRKEPSGDETGEIDDIAGFCRGLYDVVTAEENRLKNL